MDVLQLPETSKGPRYVKFLVEPSLFLPRVLCLTHDVQIKEPSVSKTGRVRRPPGHLKDFVLY